MKVRMLFGQRGVLGAEPLNFRWMTDPACPFRFAPNLFLRLAPEPDGRERRARIVPRGLPADPTDRRPHINSLPRDAHPPNRDSTDDGATYFCEAFPDEIPDDIRYSGFDHRHPYPTDGGVRHELAPGKADVLAGFERDNTVDVRTRDVTTSAQAWMRKMGTLRARRLELARTLLDAGHLTIPVRNDGTPVIWIFDDYRMLAVSTTGSFRLDFIESDDSRGWRSNSLEKLAADIPGDVLLYVDKRGPLLPVRALHSFNISLFRMVRDGCPNAQLREEFAGSLAYQPEGERAVFTSLLALEASRGITAAWRPVHGGQVLAEGEVVIDPGYEHEVRLVP